MILWQNHHNRVLKHSLPIVTGVAVVLVVASLARSEVTPVPAVAAAEPSLVAQAARHLASQPAVAAKIRQRATQFGQQLVGSGSYQQILADGRTLFRLEMKLQVAGQITSLQQVSDGVTLWIRRDADGGKAVSYVNLFRIRESLRGARIPEMPANGTDALAIGGLCQLLQGLDDHFHFDEPQPQQFRGIPVWTVRGSLKGERLFPLLPPPTAAQSQSVSTRLEQLPSQFPDTVTVVLGRDDFMPLFPYRIEYGRRVAAARQTSETGSGPRPNENTVRPIVTIELFEVRREFDFDPRLFIYKLGEEHVDDRTEVYLKRLGLLSTSK